MTSPRRLGMINIKDMVRSPSQASNNKGKDTEEIPTSDPSQEESQKVEKPKVDTQEKYFLDRFESEITRINASLGKTKAGAKMFELSNHNTIVLPQNWNQMVEEHNLWLMAEKCMQILKYRHAYDEETVTIDVSTKEQNNRFIDGLLISLTEKDIDQHNYGTTSEIEKGRMEGNVRRAINIFASEDVPWNLCKHSKANVTATLTYVDTLYTRIASMITTKSVHQKVALWLTKLFNSAQIRLSRENTANISKWIMSFDDVWSSLGDVKKGADGKVKYDKSGNAKRYHPSKPDFAGMEKTEVLYVKDGLSGLWESIETTRKYWSDAEPKNLKHIIINMRSIYAAQVKAVKATKALADSRIEALGLPRAAPKMAISNRKAQRIATGDYRPMFDNKDLQAIIITSDIDRIKASIEVYDKIEHWNTVPYTRASVQNKLNSLIEQKKLLLNPVVRPT